MPNRISLCGAYDAVRAKQQRPCGWCGHPVGCFAYLDGADRAFCSEGCYRAELSGVDRPVRPATGGD
jgi:hypothetical protein